MNKEKTWLFITRAQPWLHAGQIDGIQQAISQWVCKILIWIWSSNKEYTAENPFTCEEREIMVRKTANELLENIEVEIYPIPDFGDYDKWTNHIFEHLPKFDCILSGNPWVQDVFKKNNSNIEIIPLKIRKEIKWSNIRQQIATWNMVELEKALPNSVIKYLDEIGAHDRLGKILKSLRKTPNITVDAIIVDENGKLILIERKNPPFGAALPWWYQDIWETSKEACTREVREEISAKKATIKDFHGIYDDPKRDPREHNVSIVYEVEIEGEPKAADDAKAILKIDPYTELDSVNFAFDHKEIVQDRLDKNPK